MSHYGSPVIREQHVKSRHSGYWPLHQQKGKIAAISADLVLSWAPQEWGDEREPSLHVAAVHLAALTKIKFLRFKEMPKWNKMTARRST